MGKRKQSDKMRDLLVSTTRILFVIVFFSDSWISS